MVVYSPQHHLSWHLSHQDILLLLWYVLYLPCRYADSLDSHLQSLVLHHMPSNLQKLDRSKAGRIVYTVNKEGDHISVMWSLHGCLNWLTSFLVCCTREAFSFHSHTVLRPNMDSYVFIRAVERTEQVKVDPE